jgi:hypothetical protein
MPRQTLNKPGPSIGLTFNIRQVEQMRSHSAIRTSCACSLMMDCLCHAVKSRPKAIPVLKLARYVITHSSHAPHTVMLKLVRAPTSSQRSASIVQHSGLAQPEGQSWSTQLDWATKRGHASTRTIQPNASTTVTVHGHLPVSRDCLFPP